MFLNILRGLFILLMAAVAWSYLNLTPRNVAVTVSVAIALVGIDILSPRRKLITFVAALFGLIVGLTITFVLHFVVELLVALAITMTDRVVDAHQQEILIKYLTLIVALASCYLSISFVLQTRDDVRFIIPYVEFSKKVKGARPLLVDTSALIDGRICDVAATGIVDSQLVVPRFVIQELQSVADSGDKLKRNRGRRGLDVLTKLRNGTRAEVILYEEPATDRETGVDEKLMDLAEELNARVLTNDYNLNKVAQLRGVDVINLNDLAGALRPVVLPGEKMTVRLIKPGEAAGQGVGFLEDGTMVVVEQGRSSVNQEVEFTVTSALQTSAGRMIFGRMSAGPDTPVSPPSRRAGRRDEGEPSSQGVPSK